jgi:hypothetical protein
MQKWVRSSVRIAIGVIGGACALIGGTLAYGVPMPGQSLQGPLPPITAAEVALADKLREHVTKLAVDIGQRRAVAGDSLKRAEQYLAAQLEEPLAHVAGKLRREALTGVPGDAANLVWDLPGTEPSPLVLVGAHYDTDHHGTPGANDNGSGTAAALVLAVRLAAQPHRLPIRIVFFANEEQPYFEKPGMGSLQHAQGCRKRGEVLRAMISLETMGFYSDQPGSQRYPAPLSLLYPDRGNFIGFVGNLGSRSLVREAIGRFRAHATVPSEGGALPAQLPGIGWSDHWAFWHEGYEAIMVTDTALFRDPNYHEDSDVPENIDFERLARVVVGLERVILELAAN